jgi:hypothetical protein
LVLKGAGKIYDYDIPDETSGRVPLSLGSLVIDGGTLNEDNWKGIVEHSYTVTDDIDIGSGGVTVSIADDREISRILDGSGSFTKEGTGKLTLSGSG